MANLYYFNPWHDLALANGDPNYQPPSAACAMESDLALLPLWYAGNGDTVRCSRSVPKNWLERERNGLQVGPEWKCLPGNPADLYDALIPWGWNAALVKKIRNEEWKLNEELPDDFRLEEIRRFSNRAFSVSFGRELKKMLPEFTLWFCGSPEVFDSYPDILRFIGSQARSVLKMPWSGSGRGLCWCHGEANAPTEQWIRQGLRRQKTLIGEPMYDKIADLALEFDSDGKGQFRFTGYSLFYTDSWGTYRGNLLASDEEIEGLLAVYFPPLVWSALREQILFLMKRQIGSRYAGPVGVDMMICRSPVAPFFRLHPCVEINFRQTMGWVARRFYDRYVAPGRSGRFYVDYSRKAGELLKDHRKRTAAFPLTAGAGKVTSGYMALTPVEADTRYRVRVEVK